MTPIPFSVGTSPGANPQENAGRLINAYAEPLGDKGPSGASIRRVPGMALFASPSTQESPVAGLTGYRGAIVVGNTMYAAYSGKLVTVSGSGVVTEFDDLTGDDPVFMARNNKATTPDIVIVCEDGAFEVGVSSITSFVDVDLPACNAVCFHQGYFIFTTGDGKAIASGLNATTINALDFVTAEGNPDGLVRPVSFGNNLFLFGTSSTEVFGDPVNDVGFPFSRVTVIRRGLLQNTAVCGFEDGFPGPIMFVGDDYGVYAINGFEPVKISPPVLDRMIKDARASDYRIEFNVHVSAGNSFASLSCDDWTWEFNLTTKKWHERKSYGATRWRGKYAIRAFNKWLAGDDQSDKIGEITETMQTEFGEPLVFEVESGPVIEFPSRQRVARADFLFAAGVGVVTGDDPTQTNPTVEISYSPDGIRWSDPMQRKLGRQGEFGSRIMVANAGISGPGGHRWRVSVSDAVQISLMGGTQSGEFRAN